MPETQPNVYETCDPTYLQQLRGQVGMDIVQLARIACLSAAQVKSLEQGRDDLFYSPAIKRQAYKRALMILGAPPPPAVFAASEGPEVVMPPGVAPVNESLNHIADLTTHAVDDWKGTADVSAWLIRQKFVLATLAFGATFGGLLAIYPNEGEVPMSLASAASPQTNDEPLRAPAVKPVAVVPQAALPVVAPLDAAKTASELPAVVVATRGAGTCAFSSDPGPEVSPATPKKEGKFVYVLSPADTTLCVVDGRKQASTLQLKAGEGRSVYGASPWQLSGSSLAQVQIYFQGWRASLPEGAVEKIVLVEKTLVP